jgi:hypothetical protein
MPDELIWRRCGTCQQLSLVSLSANLCWQCGAALPKPNEADTAQLAQRRRSARDPGAPRLLVAVPASSGRLTAGEDAVARRILARAFPNGLSCS